MRTVVRWFVVVVLTVHGLIHLMGAAKGLGWARVDQLTEPVGALAGVGWVVAGLLVLTAAVVIAVRAPAWCGGACGVIGHGKAALAAVQAAR